VLVLEHAGRDLNRRWYKDRLSQVQLAVSRRSAPDVIPFTWSPTAREHILTLQRSARCERCHTGGVPSGTCLLASCACAGHRPRFHVGQRA
jgi:hypothetical protein